jgi:hypothetical protein
MNNQKGYFKLSELKKKNQSQIQIQAYKNGATKKMSILRRIDSL